MDVSRLLPGARLTALGLLGARSRPPARSDPLEVAQAQAERRMAAIVRHSSDVVAILDDHLRITFQSPSIRGLGHEPDEVVGAPLTDLVHPDDRERVERALLAARVTPLEYRWQCADGSTRLVQHVANDLRADPDVAGIVLTLRDVTEQRLLEDQLRHRAAHDALTGLANRTRLDGVLEERLGVARAGGPAPALVLLDLDDFKHVNDSLGHAAGDALLVTVADRLADRAGSCGLVARLGGDEFAIVFAEAGPVASLTARSQGLLAALAAPFEVGGRSLRISASAGVCLATAADGPDEVLRNADLALYTSKARGKGGVTLFRQEMHDAAVEALELESDLGTALADDALELRYQPLFNAGDEVVGLEALLRWRHPRRGVLAPGLFLDAAERSRLIVPIGRWVLHEACRQAAAWDARHPALGQLGMGVNVSAEQLRDPVFVSDVRNALAASGLRPERLVLEITETAMMQDLVIAARALEQIKALGVRLALDDFGTGYSSLAYLQRLPLDFLKVPRPFVSPLDGPGSRRAADLVAGVVTLGRSLGLRVVAEGVETEAQRRAVDALGCELTQGFLLARPMTADGIAALLADRAVDPPLAA